MRFNKPSWQYRLHIRFVLDTDPERPKYNFSLDELKERLILQWDDCHGVRFLVLSDQRTWITSGDALDFTATLEASGNSQKDVADDLCEWATVFLPGWACTSFTVTPVSIDPLNPSEQDRIDAFANREAQPSSCYTADSVIVSDDEGYSFWVYTEAEGLDQGFSWTEDEKHTFNGITWIIQEA